MANIRNYHQLQEMRQAGFITECEYSRITRRIEKDDKRQCLEEKKNGGN
jgi:hypothetical protein